MTTTTTTTTITGNARRQGELWGARPTDWAEIERQQTPTYEAALEHLDLEPGHAVLDRVPEADLRHGELEHLPYADGTFDAVTSFNSIFFAAETIGPERAGALIADALARFRNADGSYLLHNEWHLLVCDPAGS